VRILYRDHDADSVRIQWVKNLISGRIKLIFSPKFHYWLSWADPSEMVMRRESRRSWNKLLLDLFLTFVGHWDRNKYNILNT
jgi:hypothetical protein